MRGKSPAVTGDYLNQGEQDCTFRKPFDFRTPTFVVPPSGGSGRGENTGMKGTCFRKPPSRNHSPKSSSPPEGGTTNNPSWRGNRHRGQISFRTRPGLIALWLESTTKVASSCPDPTGDDVLFIVEIPRVSPKRVSISYSTKSEIPIVVAWPENHRKTVKTVSGIGFCEIDLGEVLKSMGAARDSTRKVLENPVTGQGDK